MTSPPVRTNLSHGPVPRILWFTVVVAATAAFVADRIGGVTLPDHALSVAAVLITTAYAGGLAHRTGGRPFVSAAVGLALGAAAVLVDTPILVAGVALATAVLAGLLAVMVTTPASGLLQTVREVAVAVVVSSVGALAVAAYGPAVDPVRFRYVAVIAALVGVIALVSGLGAGLHGLGRRGAAVLVAGTVILVGAVVYGEALSRWGSPDLISMIEDLRSRARSDLGAVPHPIEALLGYPALAWGVFMRARRRQGWWVCVFGVAATISTAGALVDPSVSLDRAALGSAYSLVVGLLLGYAVIRADLFFTGPRGGRARRDEAANALRPEPGRTRALR